MFKVQETLQIRLFFRLEKNDFQKIQFSTDTVTSGTPYFFHFC